MASSSSPLPYPLLTLKRTSPRSPSLPSILHLPSDQPTSLPTLNTNRRELLISVASISTLLTFHKPSPSLAREVEVGAYLPPCPSDPSFVVFKASPTDTPALRAGNVQPYQFLIPPTWKQARVANILSGNYCQPKCAEPWVEVKFESEKDGKVQVVASPLIRLTNKPNATIEEIGSPDKVIASLGPFVTGNTYDSDELIETSVEKLGDQTVSLIFQLCLFVDRALY